MSGTFREKILEKEPMLPMIEQALDQHSKGIADIVTNPANGKPFEVKVNIDLSILTVHHDGRVVYRERFANGALKQIGRSPK